MRPHLKKNLKSMLVTTILLISLSATTLAYVGNSKSMELHDNDCRWGKKISDSHRIGFESRYDAINEGYVPCNVCRP